MVKFLVPALAVGEQPVAELLVGFTNVKGNALRELMRKDIE